MNTTQNNSSTIFITGGAGYVGAMLIDLFSKRLDVAKIIAIDKVAIPDFIKDMPEVKQKVTFIVANTCDATWQKIAADAKPDVVIHTAWQIREMYGKKPLQWKWNIDGSDNVFDFAFSTPSVKKLIHFSTVASYGAYPDNTIEHHFTEAEGFRKTDYLYAEEKRISEEYLEAKYAAAQAQKGSTASKVKVAIIRPAAITGPRGRYMRIRFGLQSALSGQLKESFVHRVISLMVSFVPVTPKWCRQFIHEDDIADVVTLLAFNDLKNPYDAFNACPPGAVVLGKDMAAAVNKKPVMVYPWMIRIVFFCAWNFTLGRVPTSKGGWKSYSYPIVVDGTKLSKMYGYHYKWQSKDAFVKKEGRYAKYIA
jgi:nucleoside-diphosphate-sugar epimerase